MRLTPESDLGRKMMDLWKQEAKKLPPHQRLSYRPKNKGTRSHGPERTR